MRKKNLYIITAFAGSSLATTALATPEDTLDTYIVRPNDKVSMRLFAVSNSQQKLLFNNQDNTPAQIPISPSATKTVAGTSTQGAFDVLVGWREYFENGPSNGEPSRIRFDITTEGGQPFINSTDFGAGFRFVRWEIGDHNAASDEPFANPINFLPFVTNVQLSEASVRFFEDNTVVNSVNYGFTLGPTWDGTDALPGNIFNIGSQVNRIEITYEYLPVPAPAGFGALAGAGLFASRRRRR